MQADSGEEIVIKGELVELRTISINRQVPLKDWLDNIEVVAPVTLPTIGRTQVFAHYDKTGGTHRLMVLTEIPAGIRHLEKNLRNGTARRYRLAMPWTYLWFACESSNGRDWGIGDYRVFHARERYNGITDEMIVARVPNVYHDGRICWGSAGVSPSLTLADRLDQLTNDFYVSRFNSDLDGNVPLPYNEPNYARWVRESAEDAASWRRWPEFTDRNVTKYTVENLLQTHGVTPRLTEIVMPDAIPEVPVRLTFGRWDEWWMALEPEQRAMAQISLGNLALDDAANVPIGQVQEAAPVEVDDGGTTIDFRR
jgi:hypothetical protein